MSRRFDDGPENFAARMESLQHNVTWADAQRNKLIFRDQMFDFRCNGTLKRIGLMLWALPLLIAGVGMCVSAYDGLSSSPGGSFLLALGTFVFVGLPAIGASGAAIWTVCFLRPPAPKSHLRSEDHR